MSLLDRRSFLTRSAAAAGGAVLGAPALSALTAIRAGAVPSSTPLAAPYGPLAPTPDLHDGVARLALPAGFEYRSFSRTAAPMSDGTAVPARHDGMGAFGLPDGRVRLIRNHEVSGSPNGAVLPVVVPAAKKYDVTSGGGLTTLDFDPDAFDLVRDWASLGGTRTNCAGGINPIVAGWYTCEENTNGPNQGFAQRHGYVFFQPADAEEPVQAVPHKGMGRFRHEAVAVDPRGTGVVYETEDDGDTSGFYRYVPKNRRRDGGGVLEMLAVVGRPMFDTMTGVTPGERFEVEWVTIDDPDPDLENGGLRTFHQGREKGAAAFNRLEGIWYDGAGNIYFNSTSGGDVTGPDGDGYGQIWKYRPQGAKKGTLTLFYESPGGSVLESPDNLVVTPGGSILVCEDDAVSGDDAGTNRLVGVTTDGVPFHLAANLFSTSEFAGACFSPDGEILFVNIQGGETPGSGMTFAIRGPWGNGPI